MPRACDIDNCGPEPLTTDVALVIRMNFDTYKERRLTGLNVEQALVDLPVTRL